MAFGGALPGLASARTWGPKVARTRHRSERCERSAGRYMQPCRLALQHSRERSRVLRRQRAEPPAKKSLGAQHFKTSAAASPASRTARAATTEPHMSRGEGFRNVAWREWSSIHSHMVVRYHSTRGPVACSETWATISKSCLGLSYLLALAGALAPPAVAHCALHSTL